MAESTFFSFGALLKAFRRRRHLTQQQLASIIGVHRSAIIRWEQGDFLPESKTMVLELARHLNLNDQETRQLLEASLTALTPHWSVPFPRNPFFTGREEILEILHTHLSTNQVVALTQSYALQGLGGIGKTQVALEYAYRYALEYSAVFWIGAETEESIVSSLLHIAEVLQLLERDDKDQQRVVAAVQRWLNMHGQWLLVWDNVEDLALLDHFLPFTRSGAMLITTRRQALGTFAQGLDLLPMEQEEGVVFLLRRAKVLKSGPEAVGRQMRQFATCAPTDYTAAADLVTAMGGLPLALDQAGAYIEEAQCSLSTYLELFRTQYAVLLQQRGEGSRDHPASVSATFTLAVTATVRHHPAILDLLRICALLQPDAIPEELFRQGGEHLGTKLKSVCCDALEWDRVVAIACSYSLLSRQPRERTLSLHRLVQVILQEEMSEQEQATVQRRVIHLLKAVFPETTTRNTEVETWERRERLLPHVLTCLATTPEHLQDQEVATLLLRAAVYLDERGQQGEQVERLYQRALHLFEHLLGSEHPHVGSCLYQLAMFYRAQGKYEQAERLLQRAIRIQEQTLGSEHPEVAYLLSSMAFLYYRQGRYGQAEACCQRALRIQEQALGETHPDLTSALGTLAMLYHEQGKYGQAESMLRRVLQIQEQTLGPEHPELARILNNLGNLYIDQGKYVQAEPLCQRAVLLAEQGWGAEHINTSTMFDTLATLYREMGQYERAKPLYQRALQIVELTRGLEHPFVAYSLHGLALVSQRQGKDDEAEFFYQRALHLREQQLGPHHPEVAQTLHDLALFRKSQGNLHEARSLALRALQIREKALGDAHPHSAASRTLMAQFEAEQEPVQDGVPFPGGAEEHSTARLREEMRDDSPSENDPLQEFLTACCELHPRAWCRSSDLWEAYQCWIEASQEGYPLSRGAFIAQLKRYGCRADRTKTTRIWRGVALVNKNDDGG